MVPLGVVPHRTFPGPCWLEVLRTCVFARYFLTFELRSCNPCHWWGKRKQTPRSKFPCSGLCTDDTVMKLFTGCLPIGSRQLLIGWFHLGTLTWLGSLQYMELNMVGVLMGSCLPFQYIRVKVSHTDDKD